MPLLSAQRTTRRHDDWVSMSRFSSRVVLIAPLLVILALESLMREGKPLEKLNLASLRGCEHQWNAATASAAVVSHNTATTSTMSPSLVGSLPCPSFEQGGVILFFHISKTGGTTVRRLVLQQFKNDVVVKERVRFTNVLPELKRYVEGASPNNKTLFIEIHDGPNLNLWEFAPILQDLRERAHDNQVPFFCFTLLRQPLPYMVSFYNFENMGPGGMRFERGDATEADFKRLSLHNPQCLFFARGEWATGKDWETLRRNFTTEECLKLYPLLLQHLDWIGTVEDMQTETLPLLSYLVKRNASIGATFRPQNVHVINETVPHIELNNLSDATAEYMYNITRGDLFLYESVKRDYPISMWTNFES